MFEVSQLVLIEKAHFKTQLRPTKIDKSIGHQKPQLNIQIMLLKNN